MSKDQKNAELGIVVTKAVLDVMIAYGVEKNPSVCFTVTGTLLGIYTSSANNPETALAAMVSIARVIMDGSMLVDES
jgi:hypothetical protein